MTKKFPIVKSKGLILGKGNIGICLAHNYPQFDKQFVLSLLQMQHYFLDWNNVNNKGYTLSIICQGGYELDWMRDRVTQIALERKMDYLLYLDTDMDFPIETIPRMLMVLETNKEFNAVCGLYTHKTPPYMPMMFQEWNEKEHSYSITAGNFPMKKPFPIAASGAGILMVKKEIFKNHKPPYFKFCDPEEVEGLPHGIGEDLYFFWKLRPKLLCDPTLLCGHYKYKAASLNDYELYNKLKRENGVIRVSKRKLINIKKEHDTGKIKNN
uniref:Glycosyltransferase n=1 Tax=viral metagenome TaxID=1070528 RepID=A0A6M3ILM6_9ZZZZ